MTLSALQKYILRECVQSLKPRLNRRTFNEFYKRRPAPRSVAESVTASLERLIDKGFLIGFGRRTPKKWFIEEVKLTPLGRRLARKLLGIQTSLPL